MLGLLDLSKLVLDKASENMIKFITSDLLPLLKAIQMTNLYCSRSNKHVFQEASTGSNFACFNYTLVVNIVKTYLMYVHDFHYVLQTITFM